MENLGSGVSRVLDPTGTQYTEVILQQGKPPLDAEFNLLQELAFNFTRKYVTRGCPSGFFGNETNSISDYITNSTWSNWLKFGPQRTGEQQAILWAVVNGWLIPVTGTRTGTPPGSPDDTDGFNVIALDPPPTNSGDFRVDYVFLEVWLARIPPNPATLNKPASSAVWRYGNVEGGFSFLPDDLIDPALGFETSERVQLQYRVRVQKGLVGLTSNPDGFDPAVVKAQGAAAVPTAFIFQNMRQALGDTGLWRAGDGTQNTLGTVDGYSYAIPICCVFRRNGVAWSGDPSPNLNGCFNRNPTAVDRTGIQTFSTVPALAIDLSASAVTAQLVSAANIPLPITPATPVLIQIGDELMTYTAVTTGVPPHLTGLLRGQNGTRAELHRAGATIKVISGRPDGLFADQVAKTDILDLRHLVNPNGFDYNALLRGSLDRLLRGQLRANWKRTGAGPQGPFVPYQDKIAAGAVALGVTKLDAPDNIRMGFSDAALNQPIEIIVKANSVAVPAPINVAWSLGLTATHTTRSVNNQFTAADVITVPVAQLKAGLPGGDSDQVRWLNDALVGAVVLRIDGQTTPVPSSMYTVTPASPGPSDDIIITLGSNFPVTTNQIYITMHAMYGPGRGMARRPDSLHSISYINPSTELLLQPQGIPGGNLQTRVGWSLLWSKFRSSTYKRLVPVTTGTYADMGSKSVFLTPFRRVAWPTEFRTVDGTAANPNATTIATGTTGSANSTTTFTDLSASFLVAGVVAGDALVISNGFAPGKYIVQSATATTLVVDRPIFGGAIPPATGLIYTVSHAQGVMPLLASDGVTPKWTTTDPLQLFCGTTFATTSQKNIFITLPRHLVPGWGELRVPILPVDNTVFSEGVNYMSLSKKGGPPFTDGDKNYVPYGNGSLTYAVFSTLNFNPPGTNPATYNAAFTFGGKTYGGMRFFTDLRGLNRFGLELPPFYGVSRLFAVYEANDYKTNGSAYDATTRNLTGGGATNLLRQNMDQADGPVMWVEIDTDGDSTYILNANAIDLSRSPTPIVSFASSNYVIEASIFGYDRGSFDLTKEFHLVMTRPANPTLSWSLVNGAPVDPVIRANNIGGTVTGPTGVLPGPATNSDQIVVNYSRTPYQGDPWGSQTNYIDITYEPGPLQSGTAFQLVDTHLDETALTRPNQKVLEVLASVGFSTTLGTGRLSGDVVANALDFRNVGYENPASYPPATPISPRPTTLAEAFVGDIVEIGTEYLGATERLPLGALFRDKDFRGGQLNNTTSPLVYDFSVGLNSTPTSLAVASSLEQSEILIDTSTAASGAPGDAIVQVDGEQGNYSLLVNFRTNRGGSAFTANGAHPGGEVGATQPAISAIDSHSNVVEGRAYLVRNAVTTVGASEVSAGGELMMLIITSVQALKDSTQHQGQVLIGTNGTNEGYAAADLYRIDGHPILTDNVRMIIDPMTIALSKRVQ